MDGPRERDLLQYPSVHGFHFHVPFAPTPPILTLSLNVNPQNAAQLANNRGMLKPRAVRHPMSPSLEPQC